MGESETSLNQQRKRGHHMLESERPSAAPRSGGFYYVIFYTLETRATRLLFSRVSPEALRMLPKQSAEN